MIEAFVVNLGWLNAGIANGERLRFPTDRETAQATLRKIGAEDGRHDIVLTDFHSDIPGLAKQFSQYENLNEVNYLAGLLSGMDEGERIKFAAAVEHGEYADNVEDLINLTHNLACFTLYPDIQNAEALGYNRAEGRLVLPDDCRFYFDYAVYGTDTAINEGGEFTHFGYIFNNRSDFVRHYNGISVPEEYRCFTRRSPEKMSIRETLSRFQKIVDATPAREKGTPTDHERY